MTNFAQENTIAFTYENTSITFSYENVNERKSISNEKNLVTPLSRSQGRRKNPCLWSIRLNLADFTWFVRCPIVIDHYSCQP